MTTSPTRAQGKARARVGREVGRPQRQRREDGRVRGRHQLGSPRLVVDVATGAVAQRLRHDEFGNVLEDTAPGFVPFGFAGGLYDADTGLVRFGARDYDPTIGRWVSKDPIGWAGRDPNLYSYVEGDPVNFFDPVGWMKLPADPSGLGPEWKPVPTQNPNGKMFQHPSGDGLEFEKGRPGLPGWRGREHWHRYPKGKKEKGEHYRPGDEIPDPAPMCGDGVGIDWEPDPHTPFNDYMDMLEDGWIPFMPFLPSLPVPAPGWFPIPQGA